MLWAAYGSILCSVVLPLIILGSLLYLLYRRCTIRRCGTFVPLCLQREEDIEAVRRIKRNAPPLSPPIGIKGGKKKKKSQQVKLQLPLYRFLTSSQVG